MEYPDRPCGQSNIRFLGHQLESTWDGTTAKGQQFFLETSPPILATWQIHCLFVDAPNDSSNYHGGDVTQVLSFAIQRTGKDLDVGFTISYTQAGQPRILRFQPRATEWDAIESDSEYWRTPSPSRKISEVEDFEESFIQFTNKQEKLKGHVQALAQYILNTFTAVKTTATTVIQSCRHHVKAFTAKVHKAMSEMCPKQRKQDRLGTFRTGSSSTTNQPLQASPDRLIQAPTPSQTRSIHPTSASKVQSDTLDTLPAPTDPSIPSTPSLTAGKISPPTPFHFLKLLFIALTLFSLLTWLIIRIRDPRRRADRAARREERQNKKLYRRAAWAHWWQTRVCALRHRHCPRSGGTGTSDTWDEKRTRVLQQEGVLEAVCQDDIRYLRSATRPRRAGTNSIAAAEEGRNTFSYESDGEVCSTRRLRSISGRSVSTLPGYESEATQPPGYATEDMTPDSSVVSTSPRISRDGGLGSEDGLWAKDIEGLDLGPGVVRRV